MNRIGNNLKNIDAALNNDCRLDGSTSEIRQLTLLLDSASGLDDSLLTLEAVYTGMRGRGIGAKVKYVNRSDDRFSQVQMGDVLHSINGQMVKTCTFTTIQNILKNCFQAPVEDDCSHASSNSSKSSVVVVALTFLHHPKPASYSNTDSIVTDPNVMHIQERVGTTYSLSWDNSESYHQQRWRNQHVRAVTTPYSERNLDQLEKSGKRALHSHQKSVPQSKLQFDSPSLHDTSQSFSKEEVLHSIFSPVATWEGLNGNANLSMSSQSRSSLQSPNKYNMSIVNLQATNDIGHCETTPQSLETTRMRSYEELSTTTKPPRGLIKENLLESIPEYVLETSYNMVTETPSFLTTDNESKVNRGQGCHNSSLPHNTLNDFSSISSDVGDPISIFLSPIESDTKKGSTSYCDAGKSLSFSYSDTYFSPSSQAYQETNSLSNAVNITLEMFDLNYVNSCTSPTKLKSIISQLNTPTKKYPELLRLAKNRLTTLNHQQTMPSLEGNSDPPLNNVQHFRQLALDEIIDNTFLTTDPCSTSTSIKNYGLKSVASNDSSGSEYTDSFLSNYRTPLSEVEDAVSIPFVCEEGSSPNPIKQQPELMAPADYEESLSNHCNQDHSQESKYSPSDKSRDTSICNRSGTKRCKSSPVGGVWKEICQDCQRLKHEMTHMEEDLATALAAHSALSSQLTVALDEKDLLKHDLSSQINKLKTKLKSFEAVWASQKEAYCLRIASLEKAKNDAERDAIMFEEAVLETSSQAKAMKSQLLKKIQDLTQSIASERESSSRALETALEKKATLLAQVEELTMKLNYRERKEVELRRLLEREHQRKTRIAEDRSRSTLNSLSASLEETRKIVDRLTMENQELKVALDELDNERRDALEFADALTTTAALEAERAEKFAAMHHDANLRALSAEKYAEAMAAKLAQKVNSIYGTVQGQDFSKKIKKIERGIAKNKVLDENVGKKDTSTQSDTKSSKQWIHLEERYQQQIQELKVQSEANLREKAEEIDNLLQKVKSLELDLSQNPREFSCHSVKNEISSHRESPMQPHSSNKCNKENEVGNVRCGSQINGVKKTLLSEKENNLADSSPPLNSWGLSTVNSSRAIALRGAGGRSGLKKKLDKVRGINKIVVGGQ